MNDRLLVIGGDSLIGAGLLRQWEAAATPAIATTRRSQLAGSVRLDLAEPEDHWQIPSGCRTAVFCAGITNQETCRRDPIKTRRINVEQTLKLSRRLLDAGCFLVFISTNLVFDGTRPLCRADEPVSPVTEYGRQKAEVERRLAEFHGNLAIVRLTKVVHPGLQLLRNWREAMAAGRSVDAFHDYICSPVPLHLAIGAIAHIAGGRHSGVWQLSATEDISYAEIAALLATELGRDQSLVCARSGAGILEHLPQHTTLETTALRTTLGLTVPSVRKTITKLLSIT